jgi:hypothetical protein
MDDLHGHLSFWTVGCGFPKTMRLFLLTNIAYCSVPSHQLTFVQFGSRRELEVESMRLQRHQSEAELQLPCHKPNMQKYWNPKISQPQALSPCFSYA